MPKIKIVISVCIFSVLLGITSIVKTQTRVIEKKIIRIEKTLSLASKDLHETQLDYFYLSSPSNLAIKIENLAFQEYYPVDYSRIYLKYSDFLDSKEKITILKVKNEKKN